MSEKNALLGASNFVEQLKHDHPGRDDVRDFLGEPTQEDVLAAFDELLRSAGVVTISPQELLDGIAALSVVFPFAMPGLNPLVARTIFADGVMHGIALAGNLSADKPQV